MRRQKISWKSWVPKSAINKIHSSSNKKSDRCRAMRFQWPQPRWMFYTALTAEEKPEHHYFVKLHIPPSNMSAWATSPRPSVYQASIRCVNLVSSFYRCHHRFLKWEVFLPYSLITTSTFTDGVFHCSHRVGIRQLSYCPNRLILFRITFITVGLFRWTSNPAQTTLDKFLMLIRNRPNHFHTPIRATGVKDLNCIQGFVQRV